MKRFQKKFQDRYSLLREHQILDYLNQRGAPVPIVLQSDAEACTLEMSHEGNNLQLWADQHRAERKKFNLAILNCSENLIILSELGIWQHDVAMRNFLINESNKSDELTIKSIDFSVATANNFKLQKPLWMLPHAGLHPQLEMAIKSDWSNFCKRHDITLPSQWNRSFSIPISAYQEDWTENLAVESIRYPLSVLCHAIAKNLLVHIELATLPRKNWQSILSGLLNLNDDKTALRLLNNTMDRIARDLHDSSVTPRPCMTKTTDVKNFELINELNTNHGLKHLNSDTSNSSGSDLSHNLQPIKKPSFNLYFLLAFQILTHSLTWYLIDFSYEYFKIKINWLEILILFFTFSLLILFFIKSLKEGVRSRFVKYFFISNLICQAIFFSNIYTSPISNQGLFLIAIFITLNFISTLPIRFKRSREE